MRLTADIMRDADNKVEEFVSKSFMLGAAGRFGLLPSTRPFKLALDFTQDCIKVTALSCLGLTRGGNLIDVNFDTDFTRNFDNRVSYPEDPETYLLIIRTEPNKRMEISEGIEETLYSFKLTPQRTRVEDNELPIGRVIFENGWQLDEVNFVPPCLFVSSCRAYEELAESFSRKIDEIDEETRKVHSSENRNVISVYWPLIRQLQIVMGKERELMTPMGLFSNVQKCLTAFICAFDLFNTPTLDNEAKNRIFVTTDKVKGTLKSLADEEGFETFVVPDDIGGRFSVLTAVGLLPIAAAGIDIDALMRGAAKARAELCDENLENAANQQNSDSNVTNDVQNALNIATETGNVEELKEETKVNLPDMPNDISEPIKQPISPDINISE